VFEPDTASLKRDADVASRAIDRRRKPRAAWTSIIIAVLGRARLLRFRQWVRHHGARPHSRTGAFPNELPSTANAKSIAGAPILKNLSEDKANTYFADGIQEEISRGWRRSRI